MAALAESRDVFETFFDSARIGLALADLAGRYVRVNKTYADLLGRDVEDLVGVDLFDLLHLETGPPPLAAALGLETEQQYVRPDGSVSWVLHGVATVPGPGGSAGWLAVSAQDITERRRAEQELRELTAVLTERAVRDPLTGLANRALFEERLRGALARDARSGTSTGVLFLDLDGFKGVNDEHGHAVGDGVLRSIAGRLSRAVRPSDTVARLGGDEFVVLVESADVLALDHLSRRLSKAVTSELEVKGIRLTVGVSIGVALAERGEADPDSLLAEADARMYRDKRAEQ